MTNPGYEALQPAPASFERAPEKRSSGPIIAILALVVALVLGGGAYAAVKVLGGGGNQPADALPGNALAYGRLDLDPSARTKIAAFRLLDRAPGEVRDVLRSDDLREKFFNLMKDNNPELKDIDFQRDIDPWLGDRMGVAAMPLDGEEEPVAVFALQIKDKAKAEEGLRKLAETTGDAEELEEIYYIYGDYAVFTDSAEHLAAVKTATEAGNLAENATFKSDVDALGEEGVASGWVDMSSIVQRYPQTFDSLESGSVPFLMGAANDLGASDGGARNDAAKEQLAKTGRMVGAVRIDAGYVEMVGLNRGNTAAKDAPKARYNDQITKLPKDTVFAASVGYSSESGPQMYQQVLDGLSPEQRAELEKGIAEAEQQVGLTLPEDLFTLLGEGMTLAVGDTDFDSLSGPESLPLGLILKTDGAKADEIVGKIRAAAQKEGGELPITTIANGDSYVIAANQGYGDALKSDGGLGSTETFTQAVADADSAEMVGFINLDLLEDSYLKYIDDEQARDAVEGLKAIGISSSFDDNGDSRATVRLTVN